MNPASETFTGTATTSVAVSSDSAYALVSDITRMPELSPECHRCQWQSAGDVGEGAFFVGQNRAHDHQWTTLCQVTQAEPGHRFAFDAGIRDRKFTRWSYLFTPDGDGTRITETFEILELPPHLAAATPQQRLSRVAELQDGLCQTLARLKHILEQERGMSITAAPEKTSADHSRRERIAVVRSKNPGDD